jgi:hypothetical protein
LTGEFNLWFTLSMPTKQPKFRNRGESQHWSRVQAQAIGRFNWPAKRKVRPEMVVTLASEIADLAAAEYRQRASR